MALNLQNINTAKQRLGTYDPLTFTGTGNSHRFFLNKIEITDFRHISGLVISFDHPITVITGTNKVGKTSILLLIACSHVDFKKYDSTKPDSVFRNHSWGDVLSFTSYETTSRIYSYKLYWRVGTENRNGEGKRLSNSRSWTGLGKFSADTSRMNAKIRNKEVRLIDLERLLPARNFSKSLMRKITSFTGHRINSDIEEAFGYILEIPTNVEITKIGSHINKIAYLIQCTNEPYSSYNAASGEESLINILVDVFDSPRDSLILIDEIEAGFHPNIQRRLADVIQYVSWHHKKQFIITTHSPTLLSAFPQKSRKYIDKGTSGNGYDTISNISVNAAFSKMDSVGYPLIQLYCEDDEAYYIISSMLNEINGEVKNFNRLVNTIMSGPINQVKNDYERHKRNFQQMKRKVGYACVFDGDYVSDNDYSSYHRNPNEFSFFLYPYIAPEKFLINAYLSINPNDELSTALRFNDHHTLFQTMTDLGLATNKGQALEYCWSAFKNTAEYRTLYNDFKSFITTTVRHFSEQSD